MDQKEQVQSTRGPGFTWSGELMASIVVFLVALPLCMGIAIASGVPPALGLISGIIGGIVVGSLAGSPLQVSGPAAGLAVLVWELVQKHGLGTLGVIVLIAGALQLLAGWLKLGRWFRAVSPAVVHGMLAGIGVLIFASQFHVMVDDKPKGSGIANLLSIPEAIFKGLYALDGSKHHIAAFVGVLTILVLILWKVFRPKKWYFLPPSLFAVAVATTVASVMAFPIQYISVPSNLWSATNIPTLATFGKLMEPSILLAAVAMAVVASAESLLCATATDQLHSGARTNYNRELMAQGVGNMCCGILGALPVTGVIVRSSANVEAGAKTRRSSILHGFWLLAFIVGLPFVIKLVPTAALAAVLVYIGYKLVNYNIMKDLWQTSRSELGIYFVTIVGIVAIDLLSGVMIGMSLSLIKLVYTFSHLDIDIVVNEKKRQYDIFVHGSATFIRLPKLAEALESLPTDADLHVHVGGLSYIDHACIELLDDWAQQMKTLGGSLTVEWDALTSKFKGKPGISNPQSAPISE